MRTKEEILADIEEDKARIREIDSSYAGQYLDPESDDGKAWEERNQRIDENERTVEQIEKREQRIASSPASPSTARRVCRFTPPPPAA
jgi:vacuolar-type H+-ATPase subunit I/STV1